MTLAIYIFIIYICIYTHVNSSYHITLYFSFYKILRNLYIQNDILTLLTMG